MPKIEFHARDTSTGKEFVCERCAGEMVKPAAKLYARQRPYAMECKKCGLALRQLGN